MKLVSKNKVKGVEIDGEFVSIDQLAELYRGLSVTDTPEEKTPIQLIDIAHECVVEAGRLAHEDEIFLDTEYAIGGINRLRAAL